MSDHWKTILVLANSCKFGDHCVAGLEVQRNTDNSWYVTDQWVRPVSSREGGALNSDDIWLKEKNRLPQVLDIVFVPVLGYKQNPWHKEDWLIDENQNWGYESSLNLEYFIARNLETPKGLWLEPNKKTDRVSTNYLIEHDLPSLYLIKPLFFRLCIQRNYNQQKRTRGTFTYNGINYDFTVTDSTSTRRLLPEFNEKQPGYTKRIPDVNGLCVSLTPPFNMDNNQYKVIASIIV